jgi:hypothetical protein
MTPQQMADDMVNYVNNKQGALICELVEWVGGSGHGVLAFEGNVVLWKEVSLDFVEAFKLALPRIELHRANPMSIAFFSDNLGFPRLPVVTAEEWHNKVVFDKPHWLPTLFLSKETNGQQSEGSTEEKPGDTTVVHVAG